MKVASMVGCKLFKELPDGNIDLVRIVYVKKYKDNTVPPAEVTIRDESTGTKRKIRTEELLKDYHLLEPDVFITFNSVYINDKDGGDKLKDVIVTASSLLDIKIGNMVPFCICRQSVTDIFYNLFCTDESDMMVGMSISKSTTPANFNYAQLMACDGIKHTDTVNAYRTDTIDDILNLIDTLKYDAILEDLYIKHVSASKNPSLIFKEHDKGWCRKLRLLLEQNNFQTDINEITGVTDLDFNIEDYAVTKLIPNTEEEYTSLDDSLTEWLSFMFKIKIEDITILEYDHDIDMGEFHNANYLFLRSKSKKLYLAVYTFDQKYLVSDLEKMMENKDFSSKFRAKMTQKYKNKIEQ